MTPLLYTVGRFCVRRRLLVIAIWALIVGGLGTLATQLGGTQVTDNVTLPGTGSQRTADILKESFGGVAANGTNPIVFQAPAGTTLSSPAQHAAVQQTVAAYARDPEVVRAIGPFSPNGSAQLSRDHRIAYVSLALRVSSADLTLDEARHLLGLASPARSAGIHVAAGGYVGQDLSQPDSANSQGIGLAAAIVVLLLTFGTVVAAGLPIITAALGLSAGLSVIALLSEVAQVPSTAPALAAMVGLGVGIDYSLFVVTRHRSQLHEGLELRESVARAAATAGGAVVFAGSTVAIALCSLLLAGIPMVTQMGYLSAIAVIVAMAAALTLLPAALSLVGARINALRVPGLGVRHDGRAHGWARWAQGIVRRPWRALVIAVVLLTAFSVPLTGLDLGVSDNGQLPPDTTARQAYDLLSEGFGPGFNGPLLVAISRERDAQPSLSALERLIVALRQAHGVAAVSPPLPSPSRTAALITLTPSTAPSASATVSLVRRLRDVTIPGATRGSGLTAFVGGSTAGFIDLSAEIADRLPLVIATVLALCFLLLLVAFRAPVVALKAVAMNLLSIGAALGVVTYVFSHEWSSRLLGLDGVAPIVSFVPLMMFAILFGLSMDYEVFLMTHVRERWRASDDAESAVVEGLAGTARVITSAALIMVGVFCAFLLNGSPTIKQFGLGMAAAVAVDATLIRCMLVPAILALLNRAAWWMPRWLDRVTPPLSIEGEAWFERRDGKPAVAPPLPAPVASNASEQHAPERIEA